MYHGGKPEVKIKFRPFKIWQFALFLAVLSLTWVIKLWLLPPIRSVDTVSTHTHTVKDFFLSVVVSTKIHHFSKDSLHKKWFHCPLIHYMKQPCQLSCKWLKVQLQATENEDPSSYPAMQEKKRWSRKVVKTIWQIWYAPQCGAELLISDLGLLNLSFHYSNRNLKEICGHQFSRQRPRSVVLAVKRSFIFLLNRQKCSNAEFVTNLRLSERESRGLKNVFLFITKSLWFKTP